MMECKVTRRRVKPQSGETQITPRPPCQLAQHTRPRSIPFPISELFCRLNLCQLAAEHFVPFSHRTSHHHPSFTSHTSQSGKPNTVDREKGSMAAA